MRLLNVFLFFPILTGTLFAQTAEEWLGRVDRQMFYRSAQYTAKMIIHTPGGSERVFRMQGKVVGAELALLEYLDPPRQNGTRYLKRDDNLWIYFPRQDRTMQIQGHMLRQGVEGGDLSFEDMTESSSLLEKYTPQLTAETDSTVTILLEAHDMTVSYPYKEILLDKRNTIPLRIVNSGANRTPIKEIVTLKTQRFGDRIYPVVTEIRSRLIDDRWTRFEIETMEFGVKFPEETFTKKELVK